MIDTRAHSSPHRCTTVDLAMIPRPIGRGAGKLIGLTHEPYPLTDPSRWQLQPREKNMKISRADVAVRQVDDAVTIEELFNGKNFAFDAVIARISGHHPTVVNRVSDRAYFVLSGEIEIKVSDVLHCARAHDLVLIPANTPHTLDGTAEYLIVTAPPFSPENEQVLE